MGAAYMRPVGSEGHVLPTLVNFNRGRRAWCAACSRLTWYRPLLVVAVVSAAEEANLRGHDLDRSASIVVLVFVFANLKAALDEHGVAALEVFRARGAE